MDPPSPAARVRAAGSLASQRVAAVSGLSLPLSPAVSLLYRILSMLSRFQRTPLLSASIARRIKAPLNVGVVTTVCVRACVVHGACVFC